MWLLPAAPAGDPGAEQERYYAALLSAMTDPAPTHHADSTLASTC